MWSRLTSFFRRNRRRLLITTGVISLLYLSTKYLQKKMIEFQDRIREENFTKEQIKRRFHQTQKDCYMTFISLVAVLNEPILNALPVEKIFKELQMIRLEKQLVNNNETKIGGASTIGSEDFPSVSGNSTVALNNNSNDTTTPSSLITNNNDVNNNNNNNKKSKAELWADLKITTISRFLAIIYAQSLLVLVIHIQLNMLSRKAYLASAIDLASKTQGIKLYEEEEELRLGNGGADNDDDTEGEKKFLSVTYFLISKGYQMIVDEVSKAVAIKFNDINVRHELSVEEFATLIQDAAELVNLKYSDLLGLSYDESTSEEEDEEDEEMRNINGYKRDEKYQSLKLELKNNLESQETINLLQELVVANINHVKSVIELNNNLGGGDDNNNNLKSKLATLLIQLAKNIPNLNADLPLEIVDGVGELSASVYSNF